MQVTLDQLPVAALVLHRDGHVARANDRCLALLATTCARLTGAHVSCVFPRERDLVARLLAAAVREVGDDTVTASCGVALYDAAGPASPERLLAEADAAMYRAKAAGRDNAYAAVARV